MNRMDFYLILSNIYIAAAMIVVPVSSPIIMAFGVLYLLLAFISIFQERK